MSRTVAPAIISPAIPARPTAGISRSGTTSDEATSAGATSIGTPFAEAARGGPLFSGPPRRTPLAESSLAAQSVDRRQRRASGRRGRRAALLAAVLAAALAVPVAAIAQTDAAPRTPGPGTTEPRAAEPAIVPDPSAATATPATGGPAAAAPVAAAQPAVDATDPAGATTDGRPLADGPPADDAADGAGEGAQPVARVHLPQDLSPWGMFVASDRVVKAVMIGLAFASVVTWTVALVKSFELAAVGRRLRRDRTALNVAAGLAPAADLHLGTEAATLVGVAVEEVRLSAGLSTAGVKERVASRLERVEAAVARSLRLGTGALATIGATAPFVGLFGTVWGIMNAFIGISEAQTTNLAVVAPGIAEALLATALGLVAAIPAVVIYNHFARRIADRRQALADASAAVMRLVSRDLDRRAVRGVAAAAE
jgi:biopolymer transport protein ExbB